MNSSSCKDCACPCPKIFGGKVLSSYLPQVIVYITRIDRPVLAFLIDILKKLLSGQILAMIDDFGQAPIVKVKTKCLATLAAKFKPDFRALTLTCLLRIVVNPNDRLCRAESSF